MSNKLIESIGALGDVQTVSGIVSGCYKTFRVRRLEIFAKDCQELLFKGQLFEEEKFQSYFKEPFAQEHIHQFFHSILETHSRISQLAIAKLFTEAVVRKTKYLTIRESVLLKALQGLKILILKFYFFALKWVIRFRIAPCILIAIKRIKTYSFFSLAILISKVTE